MIERTIKDPVYVVFHVKIQLTNECYKVKISMDAQTVCLKSIKMTSTEIFNEEWVYDDQYICTL